MKKYFIFWMSAFLLMLAGCSSDDDTLDNGEQTVFDASLLPGCWVVVKDGVQQNNGVWFSNEPFSNNSEDKLAKYWWRKDPTDNLHRIETTYWSIGNDGRISIWMWEGGRTVTRLTRDRLTIENWWMDSEVGIIEYQRMDSNPEISSEDEFDELMGKWDLVEVQNGPAGFCKGDYVNQYPSGSVIITFTGNGMIVFNYKDGKVETYNYLIPENQKQYGSIYPVVLIREVPFSYEIEGSKLKLHYRGAATCDHIPATFVFKRIN